MSRRPKPYDKTTHDGKTVDWLTKAAIQNAEKILGYPLSLTQGSYNAGRVSASAGTHDGGGAVDLKAWDWQSKIRALRLSGFAAWYRDPSEGSWPAHIHAVLVGNRKLAPSAQRQVYAFHKGLNGLANGGADRHAGLVFKRFRWPYFGFIGLVRWRRDSASGAERESLVRGLRRVIRGR
jgi:hypothetical protein